MLGKITRGIQFVIGSAVAVGHYAAALLLVVLVADVTIGVIARKVFNAPLSFGLELAMLCMLLIVFLPAAAALRDKAHPSISLLTRRLPLKWQNVILSFNLLVGTIICALMTKEVLELATITHMWVETIPILKYSVIYIVLGAGIALWGLLFLSYFVTSIKNLATKNYQVEVGKIVPLQSREKSNG